jgi:hypothetical protein
MPTYNIKVIVEYNYEVEADNETKAEEHGWKYQEYSHSGEIYSIEIEEQ